MKESPLFLKSFETLEWILNHTQKFPKHQRFVMAKRIEEAALAFHDNFGLAHKEIDRSSLVVRASGLRRAMQARTPAPQTPPVACAFRTTVARWDKVGKSHLNYSPTSLYHCFS